MAFEPVDARVNFPEMERRILDFWKENDVFHKSVEQRPADRTFVFYEGPPTANNLPGIHHVISRVFKDLIPRYKTMRGYRVPRKGGWDTHGLPVEIEVEKQIGVSSKPEIEAYGIELFNQKCKESVSRYIKEWEQMTDRIAFWVDMDQAYVTYHNSYIESEWWILKQLWQNGLVYQDYKSVPHCPRCGTSLSDHEVAQGYEENTPDPSVFVKFRINEPASAGLPADAPVYALAWTTTPWTLPGNVALAVKEDADYSVLEVGGPEGSQREYLLLAADLVSRVLDEGVREAARGPGSALVGLSYEPLYEPRDWDVDILQFDEEGRLVRLKEYESTDGLRRIIATDFVSLDDGTGIVHVAPAFGGEDFEAGKQFGLLFVQPVDLKGEMAAGSPFGGLFVKKADAKIEADLRERGLLLRRETIKHTYPFCWRCGTPLLYYAKPSWYIRTTAMKQRLNENNQRINWYPEHVRDGRFGNWLENNIDWAVSRERYWGTPLPIWRCELCGQTDCVGSKEELVERARDRREAEALTDYHRPYVDEITLSCPNCAGTMRRTPEVLDAWFDSGAMPYAQWGYPYGAPEHGISAEESQRLFNERFPADYICEAVDQTRGWFYTLHAEATLLNGLEEAPEGIAYRNVICLGHILDAKGEKMSKSKGNVVDPWSVLDKHGADATRWYLFTASPPGNSRRFSVDLVGEALRKFLLTLWNTYSFFVTYARIDGYIPSPPSLGGKGAGGLGDLDRWVLSELNQLVQDVTENLEAYDVTSAGRRIGDFVDDLSNWYVRRSRRRFWKTESDEDKQAAYDTLYTCLVTVSKLIAPFTPFVAEEMYHNLVVNAASVGAHGSAPAPESVHLADWPEVQERLIDKTLMDEVRLVQRVVSLGRAARAKAGTKVRQPLQAAVVAPRTAEEAASLRKLAPQVLEELNVKELRLLDDESEVVSYEVKPNLPLLGPKYGGELGQIQAAWPGLDRRAVAQAARRGQQVEIAGKFLLPDEVVVEVAGKDGYAAAQEAGYTVAVTTVVTPELEDEGLARELAHRIQGIRKNAGLDLADRIVTWYSGGEHATRVMASHENYVKQETLSVELRDGAPEGGAYAETQEVEGAQVTLAVRKV
jgi:isoleucyl-tRNA synthetase